MSTTTERRRRYAPRPERVSIDWMSCWRIALVVMVLQLIVTGLVYALAFAFFGTAVFASVMGGL